MNQDLKNPELSIGTNLVIQHIEELKEEDRLSRSNLEEKVEQNPRLSVNNLDNQLGKLNLELNEK